MDWFIGFSIFELIILFACFMIRCFNKISSVAFMSICLGTYLINCIALFFAV